MKPKSVGPAWWCIFSVLIVFPLITEAADRPTDEDIKFWVKNAISEDPYIDTSGIRVNVLDGIVTLSGEVGDTASRKYAYLEATKINGVLGVINELKVLRNLIINKKN